MERTMRIEATQAILGKLIDDLNLRLADRGVSVYLDESAKQLVLQEGFSEEYGARNLERVFDQMLGTRIAEALLDGKFTAGKTIRLVAKDGEIQFCQTSSL